MKCIIIGFFLSLGCFGAPAKTSKHPVPVADSVQSDSTMLDTIVYKYKKSVTVESIDRIESQIITLDAHDTRDSLSYSSTTTVLCGDNRLFIAEIKPGDALTLSIKKHKGNKSILHIQKRGCPRTVQIPAPPIWIPPAKQKDSPQPDSTLGTHSSP